MTPFGDILAWAQGLPRWQQEAVRIILSTNASIPRAALPKLADLCIAEVAGEITGAAVLTEADLPATGAPAAGVTLQGFGLPQNVNALKGDQWLDVGPKLTVVFGHNAAGKSGYARILKQAFRARVVEDLLPDVRSDAPAAGPAAATFLLQGVKVQWRSDAPLAPDVASRFAVFDAKSGHAYVVDNQLQIAPAGLDVLPRLVEALDGVKADLQARKAARPAVKAFADGLPPSTAAFAAAQRITAETEPADVLPGLAFRDEDGERLEAARDELAQLRTPRQRTAQLDGAIKAAQTLQLALELRQRLTGKKGVQDLADLRAAAAEAAAAAKKVESLAADQKLVKGVGSDAWVGLIEAAATFVAEEEGDDLAVKQRCPLCLEKLPDGARARLDRFWGVVKGEAADQRAAADAKLEERLDLLEGIAAEKDEALDALLASIAPHAPLLALSFNGARAAAATTAKKLRGKKAAEGVDCSAAIAEVAALLTSLNAKQAALQKGNAGAAAEAQRLGAEIQELEAKKLLAGRGKQIEAYVTAARAVARLDAALASIRTQGVTAKSAELNERYVTDSYRKGVEAELKRLGFPRHLPVLTQQGSKGKVRILALANPKQKAMGPEEIFSEGERTAIALASFFAELALTPSPVGLVFDDPIAALDQPTRARVAERLAAESAHRQVIVFTHDRAFVEELRRFAKDPVLRELRSTPEAVGLVGPWAG